MVHNTIINIGAYIVLYLFGFSVLFLSDNHLLLDAPLWSLFSLVAYPIVASMLLISTTALLVVIAIMVLTSF